MIQSSINIAYISCKIERISRIEYYEAYLEIQHKYVSSRDWGFQKQSQWTREQGRQWAVIASSSCHVGQNLGENGNREDTGSMMLRSPCILHM